MFISRILSGWPDLCKEVSAKLTRAPCVSDILRYVLYCHFEGPDFITFYSSSIPETG